MADMAYSCLCSSCEEGIDDSHTSAGMASSEDTLDNLEIDLVLVGIAEAESNAVASFEIDMYSCRQRHRIQRLLSLVGRPQHHRHRCFFSALPFSVYILV